MESGNFTNKIISKEQISDLSIISINLKNIQINWVYTHKVKNLLRYAEQIKSLIESKTNLSVTNIRINPYGKEKTT